MRTRMLSFDTSSSSTGWAMFANGKYKNSGTIDLTKIKDTDIRMEQMISSIYKMIDEYSPAVVVAELTVVDRNPNTQRLLTMILGAIYGKCIVDQIDFKTLRPTQWRRLVDPGKKPKKRNELKQWAIQTAEQLTGLHDLDDDTSDAILIGYAYIKTWGTEHSRFYDCIPPTQ